MRKRLTMVLAMGAALIGFLITQQIRTVNELNHTAQIQEGKTLGYLVAKADLYDANAETELKQLDTRLTGLGPNPNVAAIQNQVDSIQPYAALTPVSGPGVVVVMHDATRPAFPGEPAQFKLVHDQYMLRVVALVSAAGARAIAINGQRYTATTSIFCAGPTIRINDVPYASPFVVQAVGPVSAMLQALQKDPDISGWAQLVTIKIHPAKHLEIAPYRGFIHFFSAKPVKIGG